MVATPEFRMELGCNGRSAEYMQQIHASADALSEKTIKISKRRAARRARLQKARYAYESEGFFAWLNVLTKKGENSV